MSVLVKRGDVYSCKARRGYTRIRVMKVNLDQVPTVTVYRIGADGKRMTGKFTTGPLERCYRGESFDVFLTNHGDGTDRMRMPRGYDKQA